MKDPIKEALKQTYMRKVGKQSSMELQQDMAMDLMLDDIGFAKFNQSAGFMRYGVNDSKLEYSEPPSIPDPTPQTPNERN